MIPKKAKIISTKSIYRSKWLSLRKDHFIRPDGGESIYEIVRRKNIAIIVPELNNKFVLVKQYRYALDDWSLEFPQGFIETNETPKKAAKRELEEETGLKGGLTFLGEVCTSSGFLEQKLFIYKGNTFTIKKQRPELGEKGIRIMPLSLRELKRLVINNKIKNSPTLVAFLLFLTKK